MAGMPVPSRSSIADGSGIARARKKLRRPNLPQTCRWSETVKLFGQSWAPAGLNWRALCAAPLLERSLGRFYPAPCAFEQKMIPFRP